MATCGMCYGKGTNLQRTRCAGCDGTGYVITPGSDNTGSTEHERCNGNGFYPVEITCERCEGTGVVPD